MTSVQIVQLIHIQANLGAILTGVKNQPYRVAPKHVY